jgi:hypothetical protein
VVDVSRIVSQVAQLGGGFRLEKPFSDYPKLHYWLPQTGPTKWPVRRERVFRRVRAHQHAIAEYVYLRIRLEAWRPREGTRLV